MPGLRAQATQHVGRGGKELRIVLFAAAEGHVVVRILAGALIPVLAHAVEYVGVGHAYRYSTGLDAAFGPRVSQLRRWRECNRNVVTAAVAGGVVVVDTQKKRPGLRHHERFAGTDEEKGGRQETYTHEILSAIHWTEAWGLNSGLWNEYTDQRIKILDRTARDARRFLKSGLLGAKVPCRPVRAGADIRAAVGDHATEISYDDGSWSGSDNPSDVWLIAFHRRITKIS